jgi:RNA polymerase sigma factor (TIGR02999 family)
LDPFPANSISAAELPYFDKLIPMSDVTQVPNANEAGDRPAAGQLLPLVYDELRKLAAVKLVHEPNGHTLDATALVHEAFLKLGGDQSFATKSNFMRAAAEAMRRILVDHARAKRTDKRGGGLQRVTLEDWHRLTASPNHLLALDEAVERLAAIEPRKAELVKLRFFGGLSMPEAAEALGTSLATAERWWAFARAWLYSELTEPREKESTNS